MDDDGPPGEARQRLARGTTPRPVTGDPDGEPAAVPRAAAEASATSHATGHDHPPRSARGTAPHGVAPKARTVREVARGTAPHGLARGPDAAVVGGETREVARGTAPHGVAQAARGTAPHGVAQTAAAAAAYDEPARTIEEALERLLDAVEHADAIAEWMQGG